MLKALCGLFLLLAWNDTRADLVEDVSRFLSSDELGGRRAGSIGNKKARNYIIEQLEALGAEPAGEDGTYLQTFSNGANILAIIRPKNNLPAVSPAPLVMLGAHYDHVRHCKRSRFARSRVCNGAADNAGAVAAVLAAAEKLLNETKTPVALAFWDAEEQGLDGSRAFVKNPTFPLESLRLYINLDIIGLNLFRGFENNTFIIGAETGGPELKRDTEKAAQGELVKFHQLSYGFGHYRSDMTSFVLSSHRVPILFITDGDGKVYHTSADEFENLNLPKVRSIASTIAKLALITSEAGTEYVYRPPTVLMKNSTPWGFVINPFIGLRNGLSLPRQEDAKVLQKLAEEVLSLAPMNGLSPKTVAKLQNKSQQLGFLAQQEKTYFTSLNALTLGLSAQSLLGISRKLNFIP